jgi:hypothetical protein
MCVLRLLTPFTLFPHPILHAAVVFNGVVASWRGKRIVNCTEYRLNTVVL